MATPYISDELIHWTGRRKTCEEAFDILKTIIETKKFLLSNCPTTGKDDAITAEEQIVCFTDVPLELSKVHCSRFGSFGIAVSKSIFIGYGANPVLYYTTQLKHLIQEVYTKRMDQIGTPEFDQSLYNLLTKLSGIFQPYSYRDNNSEDLNYYQREWRIVFNGTNVVNRFHESNPAPGKFTLSGPGNRPYFQFLESDITFVIVPEKFEKKAKAFLTNCQSNIAVRVFEEWVQE